MDLQRVYWTWEQTPNLLRPKAPAAAALLEIACRPIAADRRHDGLLVVVIGCWLPGYHAYLADEAVQAYLTNALETAVGEPLVVELVDWPAGLIAAGSAEAAKAREALAGGGDRLLAIPPPSPLDVDALDGALRAELGKCESVLDRLLFARLVAAGLRPLCQYRIGAVRVDFAFPTARLGVDVEGWTPRPGAAQEREAEMLGHGWRFLSFSGREIYEDAAAAARHIERIAGSRLRR
jgi:very-short-patch-repair endonuclease